MDHHTECPKPSLNFIPKRVIRISRNQSGFSLRLVETEGLRDLYCALSYCWGGDQETKATKETLAQLKADIAFNKLPATLRDAITTTHELGLCYLFVDSLCILQDDEQDKHVQIAQMSEIYSEAAITILASRAESVSSGFLHKRKPPIPSFRSTDDLYKMSLRCPNDELGSVVMLSDHVVDRHEPRPLAFRAWAFQENLLSARTLSYADEQTTWRCWTMNSLTDGWPNTSGFLDGVPLDSVPEFLRPHSIIKATEETKRVVFNQWHDLLSEYVQLNLSCPGDKLPAISAIAERMGSALGDKYLAGMWKSRLPEDLLWRLGHRFSVDKVPRYPRPKTFRAPSWSWAAVDGKPCRTHVNKPFSLEVRGWYTELESPAAPYGSVKGGHLIVSGRLRRVVLSGIRRRAYTPVGTSKRPEVEFENLFHIAEPSREGAEAWIPMSFDAMEQEFQDDADMDIAMLEVSSHVDPYGYGLILREVEHQRFSRLGLFDYFSGPPPWDPISSPGGDGPWKPSYKKWLRGFTDCDMTTLTLV